LNQKTQLLDLKNVGVLWLIPDERKFGKMLRSSFSTTDHGRGAIAKFQGKVQADN